MKIAYSRLPHGRARTGAPLLMAAALAALATFWPASSRGADESYCRKYANAAVEHKKKNTFWRCGFTEPRWQATFRENFSWCRGVPAEQVAQEWKAREHSLGAAKLYIENNTEIPIKVQVYPVSKRCIGNYRNCPPVRIPPLSSRTFSGFMPPGVNTVVITPLALRNQLRPVRLNYRTNNRGKDTCRMRQQLIVTDRTFGKSVIIGSGDRRRTGGGTGQGKCKTVCLRMFCGIDLVCQKAGNTCKGHKEVGICWNTGKSYLQ